MSKKEMGTLYFFKMNKLNATRNEFELQKCQFIHKSDAQKVAIDRHCPSNFKSHQMKQGKCNCGTIRLLFSGLICLIMGFLTTKFTITDIILYERIQMHTWSKPYILWLNPDPEVRLNVYIFTVENVNEFLSGTDAKLKLKEIGPIVHREHLQHQDVVHHDNSTLSYTAVRWTEFLPAANKPGILNQTITVPNFAVLAAASFMNEHNYFVQIGFNFLHRRYDNGLFINITVYDYLWNYRSKLLEKAREIAPSMVPISNAGALNLIYADGPDRYNVKIGTKYGNSQFFHMNTINGAPTVPGYNVEKGDCFASVENSTEGCIYGHRITKESVVSFWRKALCRKAELYFEKEMKINGILGYKYTLGPDSYDRKPPNETDCYKGAYGVLPNGLTDVSKCYFDMPLAESKPHFYGRADGFTQVEGLNASEEKHSCYTILEPTLGFPISQAARSQINVVIPKLSSFFGKDFQLFSDMILPVFWVEIIQKGVTSEIAFLLGLVVNVVPIIEMALTCTLCLAGFALIVVGFAKSFHSKWKHLTNDKQINFPFMLRRSKTGNKMVIL